MGFVNARGEKVQGKDIDIIIEMVRGSIKDHIKRMQEIKKKLADSGEDVTFIENVEKIYENAAKKLVRFIRNQAKDKNDVQLEQFLGNIFITINDSVTFPRQKDGQVNMKDDAVLNMVGDFFEPQGDYLIEEPATRKKNHDIFEGGYAITAKKFVLSDKPLEGIEKIRDFDPERNSADALFDKRMGNSTTLSDKSPEKEKGKKAFQASVKWSRLKAIELKNKDNISFSDLYEVFTAYNKLNRPGDSEAGVLRGKFVTAGQLNGQFSSLLPQDAYKLFDTIANKMNEIKKEPDGNLKKTHAVELASFAYQMSVGEHMFRDANGRSCRMLSDTILQTFGLPPHIPTAAEKTISASIGTEIDFKKGAQVFMDGINEGNKVLENIIVRHKVLPRKVTGATVLYFSALANEAGSLEGFFHDSGQYKEFELCLNIVNSIGTSINNSNKRKRDYIKDSSLDLASEEYMDKLGLIDKDGNISLDKANEAYEKAVKALEKAATKYVDYKLGERTSHLELEGNKKAVNRDDRRKLELMSKIIISDPRLENMFSKKAETVRESVKLANR